GASGVIGQSNNNIPSALSSGLVGYWKMDEFYSTITATDSSGLKNTGTPTGTSLAAGKFGNGRSFSGGSEYLTVTANSSLNNSSFSAGGWINPTVLGVQGVLQKNDYANTWRLFIDDAQGHMEFDAK